MNTDRFNLTHVSIYVLRFNIFSIPTPWILDNKLKDFYID